MPSIKSLSVNRMIGTIKKRTGTGFGSSSNDTSPPPEGDSPEASAVRSLRQFCEHGGGPNKQGDEVLYLPPIVEAAESSPAAAAECARQIRKYLSKDYKAKAAWQYNALMVMRILTDNPGKSFTRNFDQKFVDTVSELLKHPKDPSVHQMLMETLDDYERNKWQDEGLAGLIALWRSQKDNAQMHGGPRGHPGMMHPPTFHRPQQQQNYFARHHSNPRLPGPDELASRLEEARTSAKLLSQVVINTPPHELLENELVKEFADRCKSASRSIQMYMVAENPAPDNDTMETLIDVNEQLQTSMSQHQRAVLGARKQLGLNSRTNSGNLIDTDSPDAANGGQVPAMPARPQQEAHWQPSARASGSSTPNASARKPVNTGKGKEAGDFAPPPGPPPGAAASSSSRPAPPPEEEDPFRDPQPEPAGLSDRPPEIPAHPHEPFHPGFGATGTTSSYLGRQDSAYDNATMHGGGVGPSPFLETPGRVQPQSRGPSSRNVHTHDDDEDLYGANDVYDSTPKKAESANRY